MEDEKGKRAAQITFPGVRIVPTPFKTIEKISPYFSDNYENKIPEEIRKVIYTTNPIESLNSALRKVTNGKGMFENKESLMRVLYLRVKDLEKTWSKGTRNWKKIIMQLIEMYGDRITKYIK